MKFHVYAETRVNFALARPQLDLLLAASRNHYDHVCRHASLSAKETGGENGFLVVWTWHQRSNDDAPAAERLEWPLTAGNRQLQTCLKCLELPLPTENAAGFVTRRALSNQFMVLLRHVGAYAEEWRRDVDVPDL